MSTEWAQNCFFLRDVLDEARRRTGITVLRRLEIDKHRLNPGPFSISPQVLSNKYLAVGGDARRLSRKQRSEVTLWSPSENEWWRVPRVWLYSEYTRSRKWTRLHALSVAEWGQATANNTASHPWYTHNHTYGIKRMTHFCIFRPLGSLMGTSLKQLFHS